MQVYTAPEILGELIEYAESDGAPLGESDIHIREIIAARGVLKRRYGAAADIYVGADLFIYYEQGNPRSVFAPDVFAVFGVSNHERLVYKLWEEQVSPRFVLEVTSKSSWLDDTGKKKALCVHLGVPEYFLFDPEREYLEPPLQGFALRDGEYVRIAARSDGGIVSATLGIVFSAEGSWLRFTDAATGEPLPRPEDMDKALTDSENARRDAENARRDAETRAAAAEAEVQRLRKLIDR